MGVQKNVEWGIGNEWLLPRIVASFVVRAAASIHFPIIRTDIDLREG